MASNDDYNPDTFDWGDDTPGIKLDDVAPDVVEIAIKAALNHREEVFGWRYLRKTERKEGAGRLFRVKHYVPEEKREFFEREFPAYTFIWDGAIYHHDHPVAHLCTELNELEMIDDILNSGESYIDLFGNSGRDRKYKRNCINLYTLATAKDYIRNQNVTDRDILFDMEKLCDPTSVLGKINRVSSTHSLYYLSLEQIGRIVNTSKKRKLSGLIHRHKDVHGFLNSGEQEYWVSEKGIVTQANVATGEKYTHPSLEALFHQQSAKTVHGGVTWTMRAAGGDSFIFDFVGCPNEICGNYTPLRFLSPESWEEIRFSSISVKKFLHWTWMQASINEGKVTIEDVDLFSKLRRYVAGKQRTPRLKTETMNYARRLCNKADIISIHGGGAHEIPVASMTDYVEIAFYVDVRNELETALSFHKENAVMVKALNKYYESGSAPLDFTAITGSAVYSARKFSDAALAVIEFVRSGTSPSMALQAARLHIPRDDPVFKLLAPDAVMTDPAGYW